MNTQRILSLAAFATIAFGAHAGEVDNSQYGMKVESQRSRAEVQVEARNPVRLVNGSTSMVQPVMSTLTRADVRAEAAAAVRNGTILKGEADLM